MVKETFLTLQGEGIHAGRVAVFCRFAGCNLWTGREADRDHAVCRFCDTDFVGTDGDGGGRFDSAEALADHLLRLWPCRVSEGEVSGGDGGVAKTGAAGRPFLVCTGGEPLLQLDAPLIAALHDRGFFIAVESNGTVQAPEGIDWLTISPKNIQRWVQRRGDELKLVFPQAELLPDAVEGALASEAQTAVPQGENGPRQGDGPPPFRHWLLQPMDGPHREAHTAAAVAYCLAHPQWRLSLQTHKALGIR